LIEGPEYWGVIGRYNFAGPIAAKRIVERFDGRFGGLLREATAVARLARQLDDVH
jgi:hypothetical protein